MRTLNLSDSDFVAAGASGNIYKVGDNKVIKLAKSRIHESVLRNEAAIYRIFNNSFDHIPRFYEADLYRVNNKVMYGIIIEYLPYGTLTEHRAGLTSSDIETVFENIIAIVQTFHQHGLVLRDIKPDNFIHNVETNECYMIDLGLVGYSPNKFISVDDFTGTLRYVSAHAMKKTSGFADDIIAVVHTVMFCYYNYLPWKIVKQPGWTDADYVNKVYELKLTDRFDQMIVPFPFIEQVYRRAMRNLETVQFIIYLDNADNADGLCPTE